MNSKKNATNFENRQRGPSVPNFAVFRGGKLVLSEQKHPKLGTNSMGEEAAGEARRAVGRGRRALRDGVDELPEVASSRWH